MPVLLVAGLILLLVLWRGWGKPVLARGQWRVGAGLMAIGALFAAAVVALRSQWEISLGLLALSAALLLAGRSQRNSGQRAATKAGAGLSMQEARDVLGVPASATTDEIRAAYGRLIRLAHPDRGGTSGLAAQLNAARDRLLKG